MYSSVAVLQEHLTFIDVNDEQANLVDIASARGSNLLPVQPSSM
jgi:hypothetical protein